ncbi:MAG: prolipoprotein diacylglyceryl transferase [Dysgonamonadaceae bacterium]|nr:prolipoprotein diacylglyceryl transferase [Dysgonamonadaceae bacterium]
MLSSIIWTANPKAFTIPFFDHDVVWYGILFALGFAFAAWLVRLQWENEKLNPEYYDKLFIYVIVATAVGARLGHCLFYGTDNDPFYFYKNPIEILKIWEGGLASHGGTLGIIVAVWIYSKKVIHRNMMWVFDRLVVPVGFEAAFIRMGNLMNHEIYGHATNLPWAFQFITNTRAWQLGQPPVFSEPSHPTQIYEALCYLITGIICMWMYWKRKDYKYSGLIFGVFMIGIFLSRFFIEFLKREQVDFEKGMLLDMGQMLSIPFIIAGFWFACKGLKEKKKTISRV